MDGSDSNRPSVDDILSRAYDWDPYNMWDHRDANQMTPDQQYDHDLDWARAISGEGGQALLRTHWGWHGATHNGTSGVYRIPGAYLVVALKRVEMDGFMGMLRQQVATQCSDGVDDMIGPRQ